VKIGVIADSHDHVPRIREAVERFGEEGVELLLHAGDVVAPFALKALLSLDVPFTGVFGNNDGDRLLLWQASGGRIHPGPYALKAGGVRVLLLHEPQAAEAAARSGLYDLVIYGHTHEVEMRRVGPCLVLNPGELGGWLTGRCSAALYDTGSRGTEILSF